MSSVLPLWIKAVIELLAYFDLKVVGHALTDFTFLNYCGISRAQFIMHSARHTPLIFGRDFILHGSVVQRHVLAAIQGG